MRCLQHEVVSCTFPIEKRPMADDVNCLWDKVLLACFPAAHAGCLSQPILRGRIFFSQKDTICAGTLGGMRHSPRVWHTFHCSLSHIPFRSLHMICFSLEKYMQTSHTSREDLVSFLFGRCAILEKACTRVPARALKKIVLCPLTDPSASSETKSRRLWRTRKSSLESECHMSAIYHVSQAVMPTSEA